MTSTASFIRFAAAALALSAAAQASAAGTFVYVRKVPGLQGPALPWTGAVNPGNSGGGAAPVAPSFTVLAQPGGCGTWTIQLGPNTSFAGISATELVSGGRLATVVSMNYSISGSTMTIDWLNSAFLSGGRPATCNAPRITSGTVTLQFTNPQGDTVSLFGSI